MESGLHLVAAVLLGGAGGGMLWFEVARGNAGRPLLRGEYSQVSYWTTYLSLLVLGASFLIAAAVR
jgi:hypothetical protein